MRCSRSEIYSGNRDTYETGTCDAQVLVPENISHYLSCEMYQRLVFLCASECVSSVNANSESTQCNIHEDIFQFFVEWT